MYVLAADYFLCSCCKDNIILVIDNIASKVIYNKTSKTTVIEQTQDCFVYIIYDLSVLFLYEYSDFRYAI